ncbi:MAG: MFS transporter [Candidatus Eremiobacteraeota bacterium]|nr:MFS transporter [Candidatus Eremiobacteraeota bacterium]
MSANAAAASLSRPNFRGLSVVSFAHGVNDFYSGIVPFTIFLVLGRHHVSAAYQGAFVFLWYATSSIVQPFFGAYTDRHGRWWFLPSAVAVTMTALSFATATPSLEILAVCIVVGGVGSALMHPEAGKYSAMLSGARRASGISIFQVGGQVGYAIGPAVIALLFTHFGPKGSFLLFVPGAFAVAALFALMPRVDRAASHAHARITVAPTQARAGSVDRWSVSLLVGSTALRYFVTAAFMTYLPNFLVARGTTIPQAGQIVSAFLLVSSIGLLAGGSLADRFGAVRVSIVALAGAVPFLFAFFSAPLGYGLVALLVASVLLAVQNAPGVALVQTMLPRNLGMALGLMNGVAFGIGSGLVAVIGIIVAGAGAGAALQSVSAMPLLAALAYRMLAPRLSRQAGTAPFAHI